MNRPKIAFISEQDARDKRSWSGTQYFLWQSLQKHVGDVTLLEPYSPQFLKFICSAFNFLTLRLLNKRFDYRHSDIMSNAYGKHYSKLLQQKDYDLVVVSASIVTMSGLRTLLPVVYINDRVISGAINYHKILTDLFAFSKRQSIGNDRKAITNSSLALFCSDWAADAARIQANILSREERIRKEEELKKDKFRTEIEGKYISKRADILREQIREIQAKIKEIQDAKTEFIGLKNRAAMNVNAMSQSEKERYDKLSGLMYSISVDMKGIKDVLGTNIETPSEKQLQEMVIGTEEPQKVVSDETFERDLAYSEKQKKMRALGQGKSAAELARAIIL